MSVDFARARRIVVIGDSKSGKTQTIAKICSELKVDTVAILSMKPDTATLIQTHKPICFFKTVDFVHTKHIENILNIQRQLVRNNKGRKIALIIDGGVLTRELLMSKPMKELFAPNGLAITLVIGTNYQMDLPPLFYRTFDLTFVLGKQIQFNIDRIWKHFFEDAETKDKFIEFWKSTTETNENAVVCTQNDSLTRFRTVSEPIDE